MNIEFYKNRHSSITYELNEGTVATYHYVDGAKNLLPEKISLISYKGLYQNSLVTYQLNATYKKAELGYYYDMNNRVIHTKLISKATLPDIIGYGDIDRRFKKYDLILVAKGKSSNEIIIHHFEGCAQPEHISSVLECYKDIIEKQKPQ
jgi:hypothetical protein